MKKRIKKKLLKLSHPLNPFGEMLKHKTYGERIMFHLYGPPASYVKKARGNRRGRIISAHYSKRAEMLAKGMRDALLAPSPFLKLISKPGAVSMELRGPSSEFEVVE